MGRGAARWAWSPCFSTGWGWGTEHRWSEAPVRLSRCFRPASVPVSGSALTVSHLPRSWLCPLKQDPWHLLGAPPHGVPFTSQSWTAHQRASLALAALGQSTGGPPRPFLPLYPAPQDQLPGPSPWHRPLPGPPSSPLAQTTELDAAAIVLRAAICVPGGASAGPHVQQCLAAFLPGSPVQLCPLWAAVSPPTWPVWGCSQHARGRWPAVGGTSQQVPQGQPAPATRRGEAQAGPGAPRKLRGRPPPPARGLTPRGTDVSDHGLPTLAALLDGKCLPLAARGAVKATARALPREPPVETMWGADVVAACPFPEPERPRPRSA